MNKLVGITLGAVAVYGIVRLLKMQNVGDQTNISLVNPRVHAVNLGGLSFRTEVAINNPSKDSVKITKPVVSVKSKGKLLSQSNAENKEIIIKPLGVTQIDTIELQINWMTLTGLISNIVSKVPAVITAFKSGNKKNLIDQLGIPIEMSFSTYVYLTPPEIVHGDRVENLGSLVISSLFGYGLGLRNPGWPSGRTSRRGNTVRPGPLP